MEESYIGIGLTISSKVIIFACFSLTSRFPKYQEKKNILDRDI